MKPPEKSLTLLPLSLLLLGTYCQSPEQRRLEDALGEISAYELAANIEILASDEFEGRAPSSPGEAQTIEFLKAEFQALGLEPGNGGSFFQEVPLIKLTPQPGVGLKTLDSEGHPASYQYGEEFMAWTTHQAELAGLQDSDLVFVGYGIVAPEYDWNDYRDIDVQGKTVVILVNDPGFQTQDPSLFNGNSMTYYGRWTYKFEEAARQGAAGAFVVHEDAPAGYPWEVVSGSFSGGRFGLVSEDGNLSNCAVEGWLRLPLAKSLFEQADLEYTDLKTQAAQRGFQAVPLGLKASIEIHTALESSSSNNVLALLPGTERPEELILYMGHWDHLGKDPAREGDQIFNGAEDNASGTSGLLELARAFASLDPGPKRSILFLAVTAEEQGLLGSTYYATHPVYPTSHTVAAFNIDTLNLNGPMRDVTVIGYGNSELEDYLEEAADVQGRRLRPDPQPEKGFFYRSDHFSFAKQGVPSLYIDAGVDHVEYGEEWGLERLQDYVANRYHKPADEFDENWDLSGAVEDLRLLFRVGYQLANTDAFPNWRAGTEFLAKRDQDRKTATGN